MNDSFKNIEEYNPNQKRKMSIVFDDMIANKLSNKKPNSIVTERKRMKSKYFSCFCYTILLCCSKKY